MVKLLLLVSVIISITFADARRGIPMPDGRIVGGEEVDIANFGWQVSLQKYGSHFCGGSILNEDWVLTAAHCVKNILDEQIISVRVGSSKHDEGGSLHRVDKSFVHPSYDKENQDIDLALLRVKTPFVLNGKTVRAVPVVGENVETKAGTIATVTGWGATRQGQLNTPKLRGVKVPVIDHALCEKIYEEYSEVTENMICAGFKNGGKDSCQGDSGGPLVDENQIQIGVVSWGAGCAQPKSPGVYTNLAHPQIKSFIREHTGL